MKTNSKGAIASPGNQTDVSDARAQIWLHRMAGISALVISVSYIVIIALYIISGTPPDNGEAWLVYLSENLIAWYFIIGLSVFTDILFIPVVASLMQLLKRRNASIIYTAGITFILFILLDLGITWPNFSALMSLSKHYVTGGTEVQSQYISATNYAVAMIRSPLLTTYIILIPAIAILLFSIPMFQERFFSKLNAVVGVCTGIAGAIAVIGPVLLTSLGLVAIFASVLTLIWCTLVGIRLCQIKTMPSQTASNEIK